MRQTTTINLLSVLLGLVLSFNGIVNGEELPQNDARARAWQSMTAEQREDASVEYYAAITGYTVEEFDLLSRCVECESNREFTEEGFMCRVYVALTIINRVNNDSFPNDIEGVISQAGQFSVYSSGAIWRTDRTTYSDMAILKAREMIATGDAPNILYFNCIGYNYPSICVPFDCVGGNYFMTVEEA